MRWGDCLAYTRIWRMRKQKMVIQTTATRSVVMTTTTTTAATTRKTVEATGTSMAVTFWVTAAREANKLEGDFHQHTNALKDR